MDYHPETSCRTLILVFALQWFIKTGWFHFEFHTERKKKLVGNSDCMTN